MRWKYVDSEGGCQEGGFVFQGPVNDEGGFVFQGTVNDDVSIIIIMSSYSLLYKKKKKSFSFCFVLTILVVNYAVLLHLLGEIWREKESRKETWMHSHVPFRLYRRMAEGKTHMPSLSITGRVMMRRGWQWDNISRRELRHVYHTRIFLMLEMILLKFETL